MNQANLRNNDELLVPMSRTNVLERLLYKYTPNRIPESLEQFRISATQI